MIELPTYRGALEARDEGLWHRLGGITVSEAVEHWLRTISNPRTYRAYNGSMTELFRAGLLIPDMSLSAFAIMNFETIVDTIKSGPQLSRWAEATKQLGAAAFISFTGFWCRRSRGIIRKASSSKEGISRTFFKIREKVKTEAIQTECEREAFLKALDRISPRDGLLAKVMLQGGKRVSEVLALTIDRISYATCKITFLQSKTRGYEHETVITYPHHIMVSLREYIGTRTGIVFVTSTGKGLHPSQLNRNFRLAGENAGISFPVTPHVLRATCVTFLQKQADVTDTDIMKVTGHASSDMIAMYDKSSRADNASVRFNLV